MRVIETGLKHQESPIRVTQCSRSEKPILVEGASLISGVLGSDDDDDDDGDDAHHDDDVDECDGNDGDSDGVCLMLR